LGLDIAGENGRSAFQLPSGGTSFGDTLKKAIGDVSTQQDTAQDYLQRFVRGEPVELHQVMAASEEAQLSLEMLVELRNKLMDAYKSVVNMG
jgi:flagellar hook-basal body complex protein FliE